MKKGSVPRENGRENQNIILVLFALSTLFLLLVKLIPLKEETALKKEMISSAETMERAMAVLRDCQREKGISFDRKVDPNQTGLIGVETSSITTSLGSLEAKRTTTNPNFAALVVFLLKKAGVKEEETIAVGASGSFPALILAILSAARAMNLSPLLISSLGASQWGANRPNFHSLRMQECLLKRGMFDIKPIAVSIGGERDRGEDMKAEGRLLLTNDIKRSRILFVSEPNLEQNVRFRMRLYRERAGQDEIKAFVNIGGSWTNMGVDSQILRLKPGLIKIPRLPSRGKRGMIYEMAANKVPVIHLLYIRGLVQRYGLSWDPMPLPRPGEGKIYQMAREKQPIFILLAALYLFIISLVLVFKKLIQRLCE